MGDNDIDQLRILNEELGLDLTLKSLIESFQELREWYREGHKKWLEERRAGHDAGYREGLEWATTHDYINREDLKAMTLKQITDMLYEGD